MESKTIEAYLFPQEGFVRIKQIIGDKKTGVPGVFPVSPATWWAGVKSGKFPQPYKLGPSTTVWDAQDIWKFIKNIKEEHLC